MKIAVIGTGYVGLVSGLGLAAVGHHVTCVDINPKIVDSLKSGIPTIHEDGLETSLASLLASGHISFELATPEVLAKAEVILIAVGTPSKDGNIDLAFVKSAARMAGESLKISKHHVSVIVKSTVIPGTTSTVVLSEIRQVLNGLSRDFGIGMNPEFLREGSAIDDFKNPDRVVMGYEDEIALNHLREMYSAFNCPKLEVNTKTAEMIKYANNFFLALQISATNEVANLASKIGDIDPVTVMNGVLLDRRWAGDWQKGETPHAIASYLFPGPGFGGSCFPKDVEALVALGNQIDEKQTIAESVLKVNRKQPSHVAETLLGKSISNKKVLILGLAFKPETDDVRETAANGFISALLDQNTQIFAHDPIAVGNFKREFPQISSRVQFISDWKSVARKVDVITLITPWSEYLEGIPLLNLPRLKIVDPRRALDLIRLPDTWNYVSIGVNS